MICILLTIGLGILSSIDVSVVMMRGSKLLKSFNCGGRELFFWALGVRDLVLS